MVNKEIVAQTIKKMKDSGIDDEAIKQTLKDVGLDEEEIAGYFPLSSQQAKPAAANPEHEAIAEKTAEKVNQYLNQTAEEQAMRDGTRNAEKESHSQKLEEMHSRIDGVHKKVESIEKDNSTSLTLDSIKELNKRISLLEEQVSEIKSISNATKSVMEKVLETNRKTLAKL